MSCVLRASGPPGWVSLLDRGSLENHDTLERRMIDMIFLCPYNLYTQKNQMVDLKMDRHPRPLSMERNVFQTNTAGFRK